MELKLRQQPLLMALRRQLLSETTITDGTQTETTTSSDGSPTSTQSEDYSRLVMELRLRPQGCTSDGSPIVVQPYLRPQ